MKVQVKMGISADDLFDSIVTSVLYDVEQARGKKVPAKKLKAGFTYQKTLNAKLGGAQHVTTKITEFEPPRLYAASITSSRGVNTVRYEIEPSRDRTPSASSTRRATRRQDPQRPQRQTHGYSVQPLCQA